MYEQKEMIRVKGTGKMSIRPDTTRLTITLEGMNKDYGVTLQQSSMDTDVLKDLMMAFALREPTSRH